MKSSSLAPATSKRRWKGHAVTVLALVFFSLLVPLAFLLGLPHRFPSAYFNDDQSPSETNLENFEQQDGERELSEVDRQTKIDNLMRRLGPSLSQDIAENKNKTRQADENLQMKTDNDSTTFDAPARQDTSSHISEQRGTVPARQDTSSHIEDAKFDAPTISEHMPTVPEQQDTDLHTEDTKFDAPTILEQTLTVPEQQDTDSQTEAPPTVQTVGDSSYLVPDPNINNGGVNGKTNVVDVSTVDEARKSCQLEFGSYCLWSTEHKEVMKDAVVRRLKDQLFVARAYYPSIAKLQAQEQFSREMKQSIQEHERMLSEAISDADLPPVVIKTIQKMDHTIARARSSNVECNNFDKKLRQLLDMTEDEAHFHMKQSAFLYHLGVQTIPKSLHCLSMRLTVENFRTQSVDTDLESQKFHSPIFMHYVIFSRNILASSVAINSTVMNTENTENVVFHLITDVENYYAMKLWFARNSYKKAVIHVLNFDELYNMNDPYNVGVQLTLSEEFRVSFHNTEEQSSAQMKTEYLSVFGHSHFLLPDIFKTLKKVVVLDDDVVVQQDLSSLWSLDLGGKVVGAVEFCGMRLGRLRNYLGGNSYEANSCAWMSGLNVIDLESWREHNVTGIYQQVNQKLQSMSEASWRTASLPASLLVFQNLIYPLDSSWCLSGLGHSYGVSASALRDAKVLHYNGNMKPWLELGIPKYKWHWKKYLTQHEQFMDECNVNP